MSASPDAETELEPSTFHPPHARTEDVVETLHGVPVADPYRWLEEDSPETRAWVEAQNARTRAVLEGLPWRAALRARLDQLLAVGSVGTPRPRGGRVFYARRDGKQDQPVLLVRARAGDGVRSDSSGAVSALIGTVDGGGREDGAGAEQVLVDPNALSAGGLVSLDWWYPSEDGRLLAYGLSEGGNEWSTLHVLEVGSGQLLDERIPRTRACSVAWLPDGSGFYYTRYPAAGEVAEGEEHYHRRVFLHLLGADWRQDAEVFGAGRAKEDWPGVDLSRDGRWLLVTVQQGWVKNEVYLLDRQREDAEWVAVHASVDASANGEVVDGTLFLHTNEGAPNYRMHAIEADRAGDRSMWREIIPERSDRVLSGVRAVAGVLAAEELQNASSRLRLYGTDGSLLGEVELPTLGTLTGLEGEWDGETLYVGFTSFAQPPTAYRLRLERRAGARNEGSGAVRLDPPGASTPRPDSEDDGQIDASVVNRPDGTLGAPVDGQFGVAAGGKVGGLEVFAAGALPEGVDPAKYVVEQVWYASKDGTRVSMFVIRARGVERNGDNPTVLYGYGGFNVSHTPTFNAALPVWLDAGGVYAIANLRGGGEYGEAWHQAGMLGRKQNVFDDFHAAAEWLIANEYTRPGRLAIRGGSNGGLLVGAALVQRPDLYRAVVCQVPLLDMLRYHHFRVARLWIPEYGSAEDPEQFAWLYAYSPYHRVREGVRYPATFLLTAEGDSRVDPMHARKMAARLQAVSDGDAPVLLRVETAAGHGQGKPRSKVVDEAVDVWSFLFWQLGVAPVE